MIYNIPLSRFDDLNKKINRIRNKGADIIFNPLGKIYIEDPQLKGIFHECMRVEVEGEYKING